MGVNKLIRTYYEYVREKAGYYIQKNLISEVRSDRGKAFLSNCRLSTLIREFFQIFRLLDMTFSVTNYYYPLLRNFYDNRLQVLESLDT